MKEERAAGLLLILSACVVFVGAALYGLRTFELVGFGSESWYFTLERGALISAVILNVLGLVVLEGLLRGAGDRLISLLAVKTFAIGAIVVIVAEGLSVGGLSYFQVRDLVGFYVILAFTSQIALGISILRTRLLPAYVAWSVILWNAGWLIALSPTGNFYYPVLHHIATLLIGLVLVVKKTG